MQSCVIYNENAGSANDEPDFVKQCRRRGDCDLAPTRQAGDAEAFAREAAASGCQRIVIAGGDGTLNEVVNGVLAHPDRPLPEIGILPMGTGNDFARCLSIPLDDLSAALEIALNGDTRAIDLCTMERAGDNGTRAEPLRYFINMAYSDFGGIAGTAETASKKRWGALTYWANAVSKALDQPEHTLSIEIDGRDLCIPAHGFIIANGRYVGGGVPASPHALLDDGLFDLTVVPLQDMSETLLAGVDIVRGQGKESERVITARARHIRISARPAMNISMDGEACGDGGATFRIGGQRLRVAVGRTPEGFSGYPPA